MSRPLAILTGASSGIGAALAPILARDGYDLLLVARRESLLGDVAAKCRAAAPGAAAETLALDITSPGSAKALLERASGARLLVNNAGLGWFGLAVDADLDVYRRMIALNVTALTELTAVFAKAMVASKKGGIVFNVASTAAFQPIPYAAVYAATKAYVVAFSEGMHYETRPHGVSVLAYCPGPTKTDFGSAAGVPEEVQEKNAGWMQSAEVVAESAASAIRRRKETGVPGVVNRIAAVLAQSAPRKLARWGAAIFFSDRVKPAEAKAP